LEPAVFGGTDGQGIFRYLGRKNNITLFLPSVFQALAVGLIVQVGCAGRCCICIFGFWAFDTCHSFKCQ